MTGGAGPLHHTEDGAAEVTEGTNAERAITRIVSKRQARLDRRPREARLEVVSETLEQARKRFRWKVLAPSVGLIVGLFVMIGGAVILEGANSAHGVQWGTFWIMMAACALGLLIFGGPLAGHLIHDYRRRVRDHDGHAYAILADEIGLSISVDGKEVLVGPWSAITLTDLHGHLHDEGRQRVWHVEALDLAAGDESRATLRAHAFRKGERVLAHVLLFLILNGRLLRVTPDRA